MSEYAFMAYKEGLPQGVMHHAATLDEVRTKKEYMGKEGWVDNPAKLGINTWGDSAEAAVAQLAAQFKSGEVPAFDETRPPTVNVQVEDEVQKAVRETNEAYDGMRITEDAKKQRERKEDAMRQEIADEGNDPYKHLPRDDDGSAGDPEL